MFIRIEEHLININEIRNAYINNLGYGKGCVRIIFRSEYDPIVFTNRKLEECEIILNALTEACVKNN